MFRPFIIALLLATVLTANLARAQNQAIPAVSAPAKNDYSKSESWLCRPGRQDACAIDLSTTIVAANGKLTPERWAANQQAPIDCFYVYPTVSNDPTGNSDMVAGPEELSVIRAQFARFASAVSRLRAALPTGDSDGAAGLHGRETDDRRSSPSLQRCARRLELLSRT